LIILNQLIICPTIGVHLTGTILNAISLWVRSSVVKPVLVRELYPSPFGFNAVTPLPPGGRTIRPGD
ncbi:MAG: hypothetical protein WKF89_17590, partial [Chitinophagaceae bacterium]